MPNRVCVLGAGIIGLSSAVCIQEVLPDVEVTIVADIFTPNTTSDGSAGYWQPFLVDESDQKIGRWCEVTFDFLRDLANSEIAADLGIQFVSGYNFQSREDTIQEPQWKDMVLGFRKLTTKELKMFPGTEDGYFFTTIIMDVKSYLLWLTKRITDRGGKLKVKTVKRIDELTDEYDIVVNCAGIGANKLIGDKEVYPVRGQVAKVYAPWIKHFYINFDPNNERRQTYVFPGPDSVTIGGSSQRGDWNTTVDEGQKCRIMEDAYKLVPSLRRAKVLYDWVGLRPTRSPTRLETEEKRSLSGLKTIIHNYGHSGSGITFHWGCAKDTAELVQKAVEKRRSASKL